MKLWLSLLAAAGLVIAIVVVVIGNRTVSVKPVVIPIQVAPFKDYIAGAGMLEASTRNIAIGIPVSGIVAKLYVKLGDRVLQGDSLFKLDDRDLQARLITATAVVAEAKSVLAKSQNLVEISEKAKAVISGEELTTRRHDASIANAALDLTKAHLNETQVETSRRLIRAPVTGRILRINIALGELASSDPSAPPPMLLGNDDSLYVRVEIDEHDAWRLLPGAKAVGFVRGNPGMRIPMEFKRIEPYAQSKHVQTTGGAERSDVRVLQVLYGFAHAAWPVYIGQEMDVFIETPPKAGI